MKTLITAFLFSLIFSASGYAQSQTQMNIDAYASYKKADKQLNTVYQTILRQYAGKTAFLKNLKAAQCLWVQLRDADVAAKFPENGDYGSVQPMCRAGYLETYTQNRTKFLKMWLEGIAEGDGCNGSVKMK